MFECLIGKTFRSCMHTEDTLVFNTEGEGCFQIEFKNAEIVSKKEWVGLRGNKILDVSLDDCVFSAPPLKGRDIVVKLEGGGIFTQFIMYEGDLIMSCGPSTLGELT